MPSNNDIKMDLSTVPEALMPIFEQLLPETISLFAHRSQDYGDAYKHLGSKGQFSDINRKYWKLKTAIWEDKPLQGESVDEVCKDIIAHCLLLMLCQREKI